MPGEAKIDPEEKGRSPDPGQPSTDPGTHAEPQPRIWQKCCGPA